MRVQHIIHGKSELPTDQFVNTFHFTRTGVSGPGTPLTLAEANDLGAAVTGFFMGTTNPTGQAVWDFLAQTTFAANPRHWKVYDMDAAPPRYPMLDTRPAGQPALVTTSLALVHEIAICLSYEAAPMAGQKQSRRRGRLYIGPLNALCPAPDALGALRPVSGFLSPLRLAGQRLKNLAAAAGWTWVVHSPTTAALVDPDSGAIQFTGNNPVVKVWTDDAFDTQRRRGVAPNAKTTLVLT